MFRKVFDDEASKGLKKQIRKAHEYLYEKQDKHITRQLLLRILEMDLLPVLEYPEQSQDVLPMHYSRKTDFRVSLHMPLPKVVLLSIDEYVKPSSLEHEAAQREEFKEALELTKKRVEEYGESS